MAVRVSQGVLIDGQFVLELKWLLLGEWLGKGFDMYRETYDYTGPLSAMIYKYVDILFGRSPMVHHMLSSLLIIVQASIFNTILLRNKAFDETNYLPAFFYTILMLSIPDFMSLSPQLMSLSFVLLALGSVLRRIGNQVTDELFLNSGLFVGIATLIYLPASVFFFVFLFSLIVFSSAIARRLFIYLFGFVLVLVLGGLYFYWLGDLNYFLNSFLRQGFLMNGDEPLDMYQIFLVSTPFAVIFLITVFKTISSTRLTNFQQRVQQVIWFIFLGGIGCFFLTNNQAGIELLFVVPLLSYFMSHYFVVIKRRLSKLFMPALMVFGLLGFNMYWYAGSPDSLLVPRVSTNGTNVLVLGENIAYYADKEAGSPCFSEHICIEAFQGLDFYGSATNIYTWLMKASPDLIIDELGVVPDLFERFPQLEKRYQKDLSGNYRKVSN